MWKGIKDLAKLYYKTIRHFIKVDSHSILFIPHENCKVDNYDVINYASDNALCLFNSIIRDPDFSSYKLTVVCCNYQNVSLYEKKFSSLINGRKGGVEFIREDKLSVLRAFMKASICFTDSVFYDFTYAKTSQVVICLGYFTSFKDDNYPLKSLTDRQYVSEVSRLNSMYDYHITTSDLSSRIIASDTLIRYSKMRPLGFPRNDIFYEQYNKDALREEIAKKIGFTFGKIICYTPTFRDYERKDLKLYNEEYVKKHNIWGLNGNEGEKSLNELLKKNNAIIIAKLHPWQTRGLIVKEGEEERRVFSYYEIMDNHSLYEVLTCSDILITDYTSTCFDYMHRDCPIIYYFYDYQRYTDNRGFSYDPIQMMCGGNICYSFDELLNALREALLGMDSYSEKRKSIHTFINKFHDGLSSMRIKNFIKDLLTSI